MESGARTSLPTGREVLDRYGPGLRELAVFPALVLLGFVVWFATSPGILSMALGLDLPRWAYGGPSSIFFAPGVYGALALACGFALPRGFYLWGFALGLHGPFTEALTVYLMYQEGVGLVGGTSGIVGYVVITAILLIFAILCYTALSAIGAGARFLLGYAIRR